MKRDTLETQGSIAQDWFAQLDVLTLSPKPPSSAMHTDLDVGSLHRPKPENRLEIRGDG